MEKDQLQSPDNDQDQQDQGGGRPDLRSGDNELSLQQGLDGYAPYRGSRPVEPIYATPSHAQRIACTRCGGATRYDRDYPAWICYICSHIVYMEGRGT